MLLLANAAALSDAQAEAVRHYVHAGGGLVMTGETSLFDELGRPRHDFALADLIGVSYKGRPKAPEKRPELDANFAITADAAYWQQRVGVARLSWTEHALTRDERLAALVPTKAVTFRGPLVWVSEPQQAETVAWRMTPDGWNKTPLPGAICRQVGKGKVVYLAAAIDAGCGAMRIRTSAGCWRGRWSGPRRRRRPSWSRRRCACKRRTGIAPIGTAAVSWCICSTM